jgi:hypothetical protein
MRIRLITKRVLPAGRPPFDPRRLGKVIDSI